MTDGKEQAVSERYPQVNIIKGDGNFYWSGGMCVAFAAAIENGFYYYLCLNDEALLYPLAYWSQLRVSCRLNTVKTS